MREAVRKFKETVEIQSSLLNKIRSHPYYRTSLLVGLILVVACFHIWQRVQVVHLVHEVSLLKQDNASLLDNKKKLYSSITQLSSSERIQSYAVDSLGLKPVSADRMLTLKLKNIKPQQPDELQRMFSALKRVTDFLPVVEETKAQAGMIEDIKIDTNLNHWDEK